MSSAVLSLALQPSQPPEASTSGLTLADLVALARAVLDHDESNASTLDARTSDTSQDLALLERARSIRRLLAALRRASSETEDLVPVPLAAELEDLYDRADELVDTMLWATERRDLLFEVIRVET